MGAPAVTRIGAPRPCNEPAITGITARARSPYQTRAQLHGARGIDLCADHAERGARRADVRRAESHPVGRVERLDADLQVLLLREREILAHRHIDVLGWVAPQIAELSVEGPDVVGELLARRDVEPRRIERRAVGLMRLEGERTS